MVAPDPSSEFLFPPFQPSVIIPFHKDKSFLLENYVEKGLNLTGHGFIYRVVRPTPTRFTNLNPNKRFKICFALTVGILRRAGYGLTYGKRIINRQEILHKREQDNINKMNDLRGQGFSYWKIADVFNAMKIPTQTEKGKWYAKTIHQILNPKRS